MEEKTTGLYGGGQLTSNGIEYMTHNAIVKWGETPVAQEKQAEIEKAIKALIDALDRTDVTSIVFSKIENHGEETKESGSAAISA